MGAVRVDLGVPYAVARIPVRQALLADKTKASTARQDSATLDTHHCDNHDNKIHQ
jgi:hypothetical protein